MTTIVEENGVVLGWRMIDHNHDLTIMLPTRFVGEGNDIADSVLQVLLVRELAKLHPELPYNGQTSCDASRWLFKYIYGAPPSE